MKKLRVGTILIALGNLLYLAYIFFCGNETSDFGNHDAELMNVMTFFKLRSNGIDVVKEIV